MTTKELIDEAVALPVEERARLVDALLRSLNPVDADLDRAWVEEAAHRLQEVRSGEVVPSAADDVFARARNIVRR